MTIEYGNKEKEITRQVGAVIPDALYKIIKEEAKKRNISISYLIRRCIELVLTEEK